MLKDPLDLIRITNLKHQPKHHNFYHFGQSIVFVQSTSYTQIGMYLFYQLQL